MPKQKNNLEIVGVESDLVWLATANEILSISAKLLGFQLEEVLSFYDKVIVIKEELRYNLCFDCVGSIGRKIEVQLHYDQGIYTIVEMKEVPLWKKNLSLDGHLSFGTLPLSIVNFSKHKVSIYLSENQECLGVLVGENEFLDLSQKQFIPFQNGLCISLKNGMQRVALYRVGNQLKIEEIKKETLWEKW